MNAKSALNQEFFKLSFEQENLRSSYEQNIENETSYSNQNVSMKLRNLKGAKNNGEFPVLALLPFYLFAGLVCVFMGTCIGQLFCKYKYREGKAKLVCKRCSDNICKVRVPRHKKQNSMLNQAKNDGQVGQPNMEIMTQVVIVNQANQLNQIQMMSQQILQSNQVMQQPYNLNGAQNPALNNASMPPSSYQQQQNNEMISENQLTIGVPLWQSDQQIQGQPQIQNSNINFENQNEVFNPQNNVNDPQNKQNQENLSDLNGFQTNSNNLLSNEVTTNSQNLNNFNQEQNTQHQPQHQLYGQPVFMIPQNILNDPYQEAHRLTDQQNHPVQIQPDQQLQVQNYNQEVSSSSNNYI
eukprot:403359163